MASTTNPSVDIGEDKEEAEEETQPSQSSGESMKENLHSSPNDSTVTAVEQMSTDLMTQDDNLIDSMSMIDDVSSIAPPASPSSSAMIHLTELIPADGSSTDFSASGTTHSSVAQILVKPGQIFRVQRNNEVREVRGPATVRMKSENRPDFSLPLHLSPGHIVQQILDENGVLTHVIMSQAGPLPPPPPLPHHPHPHHVHTGYSSTPFNGLYAHPYHNPIGYGHYVTDPLSYPSRPNSNHTTSSGNLPQCVYLPGDNNGLSSTVTPTSSTSNSSNHHRRRSPVYNTSTNNNTGSTGGSHGRNIHNGGSKRRQQPSSTHGHSNGSYVNNNTTMNGSQKSTHPHYYPHGPLPAAFVSFYPEMMVQTSIETIDVSSPTEFDNDQQTFEKNILKLPLPIVKEIGSRNVLVGIQPPILPANQTDYPIDLSKLTYELLISKGKDLTFDTVYRGEANEITVTDLTPDTEYRLKVRACIDTCNGEYTNPVSFTTDACEPDPPLPPKLMGARAKNSFGLKWNAAIDNGSKILKYILEYDEGKGQDFVEIYQGTQKHCKLLKLNPATLYSFRLAAENSIGRSEFSEIVQISTLGTIPTPPDSPVLEETGVRYLILSWIQRTNDESFTLQMNDESKYFQNIYAGTELRHTVNDLRPNTEYQFRLAAHNQSGQSNYSSIVTYRTSPDRPGPPTRLRTEGQVRPTQCRIIWDPPKDNGGADIEQYHLELEESKGFHVIYNGSEREHLLEQLIPGHLYSLRVSCSNIVGQSESSAIIQIKTPAVAPASCHPPKLSGKPKAHSLHLRWTHPDYDGGSRVTEFEVQLMNPDQSSRMVYRGPDLECVVAGLLPGQTYQVQIRAFNRAGAGPWSDFLEVQSGPGVPFAPRNLLAQCRTANSVYLSWEESGNNGAPITEYRLESSKKENESFMQIYCGPNCYFEAKGLSPVTHYFFRVQAVNAAGSSLYSTLASCVTPAGTPSTVTSVKVYPKSTSMTVTWKEPAHNGSPITGYYIDIGEKELIFAGPESTEFTIDEILPDTAYKVRVRAINVIGQGPFSSTVKCQTKTLPPDVPLLECAVATCNSIKLKWTCVYHSSPSANHTTEQTMARIILYNVEMEGKDGNFHNIYTGNLSSHKINKLQENTIYRFRICAKNDAGLGPWSDVYAFTTTKAPPNSLKAPNISEITSNSCVFQWQAHKQLGNDTIQYILQLQAHKKETEYTEIYRGESTCYRLTNLESGVDYRARVCALRLTSEGLLLNSPFSSATHFTLPRIEEIQTNSRINEHPSRTAKVEHRDTSISLINRCFSSIHRKFQFWSTFESRTLTDQQWAFVISVGFALLAVFIAIFANFIYSKLNHQSLDNGSPSSSSPA